MQSAETSRSAASHDGGTSSVRVVLLLDRDFARDVEDWRRRQEIIPSRAEALRQLAARSLAAEHAA